MFTKAHCRIPGDYEFLFQALGECQGRQVTNAGHRGPQCNSRSPQISILLGCDNDASTPSSTVDTVLLFNIFPSKFPVIPFGFMSVLTRT